MSTMEVRLPLTVSKGCKIFVKFVGLAGLLIILFSDYVHLAVSLFSQSSLRLSLFARLRKSQSSNLFLDCMYDI